MDLEFLFECRDCGISFKYGFRDMPHGRVLKCPVCFSAALVLRDQQMVDSDSKPEIVERMFGEHASELKIKL